MKNEELIVKNVELILLKEISGVLNGLCEGVLWVSSEHCSGFGGICNGNCDISLSYWSNFIDNFFIDGCFNEFYGFQYGCPLIGSKIETIIESAILFFKILQCFSMSVDKVLNIDIISLASAITGWSLVSENSNEW